MAPNLEVLKKEHANKWVAFSPDYKRVVAHAGSLKALYEKIKDIDVVVMKVLPPGVEYAPFNYEIQIYSNTNF